MLERPGVQHESVVASVQQNEIEDIKRADRPNTGQQRPFAVTVKHLQCETAAINLAAFTHELGELVAEVLRAWERLIAQFWKPALHAQRHAGAVKQDCRFEALALKPQRLQHVDQANRALERDSMKSHQGFFARFCFDVLKHLFFLVDQKITLLMRRHGYRGHDPTPRCALSARAMADLHSSKACANCSDAHPFIQIQSSREILRSILAVEFGAANVMVARQQRI